MPLIPDAHKTGRTAFLWIAVTRQSNYANISTIVVADDERAGHRLWK
jgi:hypothetical protein